MMDNNEIPDNMTEDQSLSPQKFTLFGLHKHDGTITITVDENQIEARGDFIPPIGSGTPLTRDYVFDALQKFNIKHGIFEENIDNALNLVRETEKPVKDILIARGDKAISDVPSFFELVSSLKSPDFPSLDIPRIDYKTISPFIMVKKDQILAVLKDAAPGKDGKNIHGEIIEKGVLDIEGIVGDQNTRTEEKRIISNIAGRLINRNGKISVDEVLIIKGNVGYATGHISFPGDVIVEGFVSEGFKVSSGGSIMAKETLDATEIIAKKDLIVNGGIIGRGKALIKVGGSIKAKFIRNCRLAVRNSIHIEAEIVNSSVFTLQNLTMGDKGSIVGGEIYAVHGIKAAFVGKDSGKSTKIHCGIDFTVQQELEKLNYQLRIVNGKLQKLKTIIESTDTSYGYEISLAKYQKLDELSAQLHVEQSKIQARIIDILPKLNADESAAIEIKGEMSAGTVLDICDVALLVDQTIKKSKITLSKEQGKLVIGPLS
jgi:uncharacterized protein (DUF342 family)